MATINDFNLHKRDGAWFARLEGVLPRSVNQKKVLVVGCGSVGSFMADELARAGVSDFVLVDPDVVEWANLSRTCFGHADVGTSKVIALSRHLQRIFPDMRIQEHPCTLQDIRDLLPALLAQADLAVCAVDDPKACGILDRYCYHLGIPAIFVGIYKGARGGEVITVDPPRTPCLACATGGVRASLSDVAETRSVVRDRDYGTNRLVGEVALGSDIHFISAAAIKLALSVLTRNDEGIALAHFAGSVLEQGIHYLMLATEPRYYIFPATHAQAIGQHAFQSVWLKTTRRDECPRCGKPGHREPPC